LNKFSSKRRTIDEFQDFRKFAPIDLGQRLNTGNVHLEIFIFA